MQVASQTAAPLHQPAVVDTPPKAVPAAAAAPESAANAPQAQPPGASLRHMARDGTTEKVLAQSPSKPSSPPRAPVDGYDVGAPKRPPIKSDDDFVRDPSLQATAGDYVDAAEWRAKLAGAEVIRPDLKDATDAYRHYWGNTGEDLTVNYTKAYGQDSAVRNNVDSEIARTAAAVDAMAKSGNGSFPVTGAAHPAGSYPATENWQKAIGGYQQWSSANVKVEGNKVTMEITVHAEDRYNFNRGASDIATGAPDNANGRFTELGWAKSFDTHGEVKKTVTWTLGSPPPAEAIANMPVDNKGR
jgi:hypothetical protein